MSKYALKLSAFSALLVILVSCSSMTPRIEESVTDFDETYGAPLETNITNFDKYGSRLYIHNDYLILVRVERTSRMWGRYTWKDFNVDSIEYVRPSSITKKNDYASSYFGEMAGTLDEPLTDEEIERLLTINISEGENWTLEKDTDKYKVWKNEDDYYAFYDKDKHIFKVAIEKIGKKWLDLDDQMRGL